MCSLFLIVDNKAVSRMITQKLLIEVSCPQKVHLCPECPKHTYLPLIHLIPTK